MARFRQKKYRSSRRSSRRSRGRSGRRARSVFARRIGTRL